ncbi:MAG: putative calcium-binding protein [uncultured bacterium]|nr:MAG: putative calcium-binding protein [uncultured bacterium]
MKFSITIDKVLNIICVFIVLWGVFLVRKNIIKPLPNTEFQKVEAKWKEGGNAKSKLMQYQEGLNGILQSQSYLVGKDIKRNIFALPIQAPENYIFCEECGGQNKEGSTVCRHCGTIVAPPSLDSDNDGMPDYWEIKYKLDAKDPDDAHLDTDQDGRDNLQEFRDGTDPNVSDIKTDKKEREDIFELPFKLSKTYQKPVQILFMGYIIRTSGNYSVQINWAGKTDFYNVGDEVRGYVIKDFKKSVVEEFDEKTGVAKYIDNSYIICQKKKFPFKTFQKEKIITDNDVFAKIEYKDNLSSKEVYIDYVIEDTVSGKTYKVTDIGINPSKLVVLDEQKSYVLWG